MMFTNIHEKEHAFDETELIGSLHEVLAHAKGRLTLKTTQIPRRTTRMTPASIARIRHTLKASTPVFAAYLNVSEDTVRGWEKNRRSPVALISDRLGNMPFGTCQP